MICPKCGRVIPDGTQCPCSLGAAPLSSNPALNVIKTIGSSTQYLVMAILASAGVLLTILAGVAGSDSMSEAYYALANSGMDLSFLYDVMDVVESTSFISVVFASIPSILLAVGMWMHYATCRNTASGNISTAGLTLWKVILYINLICVCFLCVAILVVLVLALIGIGAMASEYYYGYNYEDGMAMGLTVVFVIAAIVVVVAFALGVISNICTIKTINRTKATAMSGVPDNRVPMYLIVMDYIMGGFSALSGLISLFSSPIAGLAVLTEAALLILMGMSLSRYRRQMTLLLYPPVQPVYTAPPVPYIPSQSPVAPAPTQSSVPPQAPQPAEAPESTQASEPLQPPAEPASSEEPQGENRPE